VGIFDRIILTVYTFILAVMSLGIVTVALNLVSLDAIWTSFELHITGNKEAALVGFVFFCVSVRLLWMSVTPRGVRQTIVQETALGKVQISLSAIENLVQKVARQVKGVRGVKSYVINKEQGICAHLKVVVSPDASIPELSDEIQNRVRSYITNVVGTQVADIQIFVDDIANEVGSKPRSRVE